MHSVVPASAMPWPDRDAPFHLADCTQSWSHSVAGSAHTRIIGCPNCISILVKHCTRNDINLDTKVQFGLDGSICLLPWSEPSNRPNGNSDDEKAWSPGFGSPRRCIGSCFSSSTGQ